MNRLTLLLVFVAWGNSAFTLSPGDGEIDGRKLAPYKLTWKQCTKQENAWVPMSDLTEELVAVGTSILRHRQTSLSPEGAQIAATTFFDRHSLTPVRMETLVRGANGEILLTSEREISESGYTGLTQRGDQQKTVSGRITSNMFHGGALGLPLATIVKLSGSVELQASMMQFDGTYDVTVTWQGQHTLKYDGQSIEAYLADVRWHHLESGDIYPPGPQASGGRFWLV
ncbi:MAG: hypothetical protein AAF438_02450, partial [Pseudomonadota bacterium]